MNFLERFLIKRKYQKKADRRAILTISFYPNEELPIGVWIHLVKRRANFRCEDCGKSDCSLDAHHITRPENGGKNILRNGTCLCDSCHAVYTITNRLHRELKDETMRKFVRTFGKEKGIEIFQQYSSYKTFRDRLRFVGEIVEKYPVEMNKYFGFGFYDK